MRPKTPKELVESANDLSSFPDIAFRINSLLAKNNSSISDISAVVETDPALTSALLRLANSPMFNRSGTVNNINQAITVIGMSEVQNLALGISARTSFEGISFDVLSVKDFWTHSLGCGIAAQLIARRAKFHTADSLFTAGLLHDIGQPVLFANQPELSRKALELSLVDNDGLTPHISEYEVFGFDHAAVGAELAKHWLFPDSLVDCIKHHHTPYNNAGEAVSKTVLIVYLANCVATLAELDSHDLNEAPAIDERLLNDLQLTYEQIPELVANTQENITELLQIFI